LEIIFVHEHFAQLEHSLIEKSCQHDETNLKFLTKISELATRYGDVVKESISEVSKMKKHVNTFQKQLEKI